LLSGLEDPLAMAANLEVAPVKPEPVTKTAPQTASAGKRGTAIGLTDIQVGIHCAVSVPRFLSGTHDMVEGHKFMKLLLVFIYVFLAVYAFLAEK
jgi:hypothetical protein